MASVFSKIKRIVKKVIPQQERRCPACKRTLQQAMNEQLESQRSCPLEHCAFKKEIRQAILESKTPEVKEWEVDKTDIFENEIITLSWEVLYAKKITISNLGKVPLKDIRTISPTRDTTYTLTIQDWKDNEYEVEQKITIKVTPLPIIDFHSDKTKIEIGDAVTFNWTALHISKVELSDGNLITDVTNRTDYLVYLTENTTYKLIATAFDNKKIIEKEIGIEVFPKPEIKLFEVSPEVVISSIPITISWRVENAKKIEINNGVGEVREEGQKTILHDKNTLYQLTAWGELSSVTREIIVKVFPTPIIESLLIPIPDFENRIGLNSIKIEPPQINLAVNMPEFDLALPDFNLSTPKFIKLSNDFSRTIQVPSIHFQFFKNS